MKKFAKIALFIVVAVVVLIAAAVILVPRFVDPNQHKDRIAALVKEKTGRDLSISGNIALSVFPWFGAEIGEVTFGNAPGFEAPVFARVRQAKVKVKLLPLLSKQVEASVVTVEGLVLNLERNADGLTNWSDLAGPAETPAETAPEASSEEKSYMAALAVGGLDIRDARISWHDRQAGTHITAKNLSLKTSAVNLVNPVTANIKFELDTGDLGLAALVDAGTRIELDLAEGRYGAKDLSLKIDLSGEAVPGDSVALALAGDAAFDADSRKFDLVGVRLEASGLNIAPYDAAALIETGAVGDLAAGMIRLDNFTSTFTLSEGEERITAALSATAEADLSAQRFELSDLAISLPELALKGLRAEIKSTETGVATADLTEGLFSLDAPALSGALSGETIPGGTIPVALDFGLKGDLNQKTFVLAPMTLSVADVSTTATLNLVLKESGPEVKGTLAAAPFNLRNLLARLGLTPPDTGDARALSDAEVSLHFSTRPDAATVEKLLVRLDDTRLTGGLEVKNFEAPDLSFDLALDRLPLDRYFPGEKETDAPKLLSEITLTGELGANAGFNVFQAARLALGGKVDEKILFGVSLSDARVDMNGETLSVETLVLNAGEMTLTAKADLSAFSTSPAFAAEVQTETFNLRRFLSDLDLDLLPETADPNAMSAVELGAAVSGSPKAFSVSSLKLRLDDTNITGKADVALSPAPAYAFDISVDSIDADRYLPPKAPETAAQKEAAPAVATPGAAAAAIPTKPLQDLDLDGKISIGALKIANLRLNDIQAQATAKDGLLTLDPLRADLYDGAYSGNIQLDVRGETPSLSTAETLAGVASGKLLKDFQGEAVVSGLANADMKLSAAGADADALLSSLGGTVSITLSDGSIKGVDIAGKICNTLLAVDAGTIEKDDLVGSALQMLVQKATGTESNEQVEEADSTSFSEMVCSMTFENGVGASEDLFLNSPMLRISGAGSLDLTRQYLDYDATASLVKSCEGQGGKGTDELKNVPIPVTIKGPFTDLKVKPNLSAGILEILTRRQEKEEEKETQATTQDQQPAVEQPREEEEPATVEDAVTGILQELLKK